jgi:D-tyrosyl-tRNA(Tyr) deacylase
MNLDLREIQGVSAGFQFTLYGDVKKGRRPSFDRAADPELARRLYQYFADFARSRGSASDRYLPGNDGWS